MATYSPELRKRALADCDAGMQTKQAAQRYGVSRTYVRSLKQRWREISQIAARIPKVAFRPARTTRAERVTGQDQREGTAPGQGGLVPPRRSRA
jgi:transposase